MIPRSQRIGACGDRFPETSVAGEPIITWASSSPGAQQYRQLAAEVIERIER